ncbi:hypothetical protein NPIL_69161 [Nephila pilipes]|uniref:Uncharacterized protein n=1 Tax=Nephila pilipes TaxID=299642 RepID=A0A8X6UAP3_NEPPI|nr:hypothetical protein NPIL_69161 [Nephila pilipes]
MFLLSGDSPHHRPSDGPEDEYVPQQPSQHAARSSAHEQTVPRKHSQVSTHPGLTSLSLNAVNIVFFTSSLQPVFLPRYGAHGLPCLLEFLN